MGVSGNYGTGKNDRLLRKELMAVLMGRYESTISGEDSREMAWAALDALVDLATGKDLSEVVETLKIARAIGQAEAQHFLGAGQRQLVIEEARASSSPYPLHPYYLERVMVVLKKIAH